MVGGWRLWWCWCGCVVRTVVLKTLPGWRGYAQTWKTNGRNPDCMVYKGRAGHHLNLSSQQLHLSMAGHEAMERAAKEHVHSLCRDVCLPEARMQEVAAAPSIVVKGRVWRRGERVRCRFVVSACCRVLSLLEFFERLSRRHAANASRGSLDGDNRLTSIALCTARNRGVWASN